MSPVGSILRSPQPWRTLSLVQYVINMSGTTAFSFPGVTTKGNLLVVMQWQVGAPSGAGWTQLVAYPSPSNDEIYIWPNNPGGLQAFTAGGTYSPWTLFALEFSGAPTSLTLDKSNQVVDNPGPTTTLTVNGQTPTNNKELQLLYVNTDGAYDVAAPGWNNIGFDNSGDCALWSQGTTSAPSAVATWSTSAAVYGLELTTLRAT